MLVFLLILQRVRFLDNPKPNPKPYIIVEAAPLVQVVPAAEKKDVAAAEGAALVEVGPRACLMPIRIFAGSFGGPVLYENPAYVSPNKASCSPCCPAYLCSQRCRPRSHEMGQLHASCAGGDGFCRRADSKLCRAHDFLRLLCALCSCRA